MRSIRPRHRLCGQAARDFGSHDLTASHRVFPQRSAAAAGSPHMPPSDRPPNDARSFRLWPSDRARKPRNRLDPLVPWPSRRVAHAGDRSVAPAPSRGGGSAPSIRRYPCNSRWLDKPRQTARIRRRRSRRSRRPVRPRLLLQRLVPQRRRGAHTLQPRRLPCSDAFQRRILAGRPSRRATIAEMSPPTLNHFPVAEITRARMSSRSLHFKVASSNPETKSSPSLLPWSGRSNTIRAMPSSILNSTAGCISVASTLATLSTAVSSLSTAASSLTFRRAPRCAQPSGAAMMSFMICAVPSPHP